MASLYGVYRSRATRVIWAAAELGVTLDMIPVIQAYRLEKAGIDPAAPDAPFNTRTPGFLAISPAGAIPVLTDGDLVLTESLAIALYLARKAGGPVAPANAAEDAQMQQWALYGAASIETPALAITYAMSDGSAETPAGAVALAGHVAALRRPFAVLDQHLAQHGHLVGGRFTVADSNMAECVRYAQAHPVLADYPAVSRWLERCQARPAFQAMWAKRLQEPA